MKRIKRVTKLRKVRQPKTISLQAVAEEENRPKRRYVMLRDVLENYKPLKKSVTLRLDADIVAWFKKSGHGYQTRINRALRKVMEGDKKTDGE